MEPCSDDPPVEEHDRIKQKNKEAAQKCRMKKKLREQSLQEENNRLHSENTVLKYELKQWKTKAKKLKQAMNDHLSTCVLADGPSFHDPVERFSGFPGLIVDY